MKSEDSEHLTTAVIGSPEKVVDPSLINGTEKSPQSCLKLTIRVRRLNNLTANTNNSINDNKSTFNTNNDNNNTSNSTEDSLLTNHSLDSKSTILYEVLPSSSATTSSSASECINLCERSNHWPHS